MEARVWTSAGIGQSTTADDRSARMDWASVEVSGGKPVIQQALLLALQLHRALGRLACGGWPNPHRIAQDFGVKPFQSQKKPGRIGPECHEANQLAERGPLLTHPVPVRETFPSSRSFQAAPIRFVFCQ